MFCNYAVLNDDKLARVKALEQKTGATVLALSCTDVQPAILNPENLTKLQVLEKELGLSLVAIKA